MLVVVLKLCCLLLGRTRLVEAADYIAGHLSFVVMGFIHSGITGAIDEAYGLDTKEVPEYIVPVEKNQ